MDGAGLEERLNDGSSEVAGAETTEAMIDVSVEVVSRRA